MVSTILHEIFHLLGFSEGMYQYYLDEKGELRGIHNVISKIEDRGVKAWGFKSKRMKEWSQSYFNCS